MAAAKRDRLADFRHDPIGTLLLILLVTAVPAWLLFWPHPGIGGALVVYAPGTSLPKAMAQAAAAGAAPVQRVLIDNVLLVRTSDRDGRRALYGQGAWLVMNPFAGSGCLAR